MKFPGFIFNGLKNFFSEVFPFVFFSEASSYGVCFKYFFRIIFAPTARSLAAYAFFVHYFPASPSWNIPSTRLFSLAFRAGVPTR